MVPPTGSDNLEVKPGVGTALIAPASQQKSDNPPGAFWLGNSLEDGPCEFQILGLTG